MFGLTWIQGNQGWDNLVTREQGFTSLDLRRSKAKLIWTCREIWDLNFWVDQKTSGAKFNHNGYTRSSNFSQTIDKSNQFKEE